MPETYWLFDSSGGCERCDALQGIYDEEIEPAHPFCQCTITELDPEEAAAFGAVVEDDMDIDDMIDDFLETCGDWIQECTEKYSEDEYSEEDLNPYSNLGPFLFTDPFGDCGTDPLGQKECFIDEALSDVMDELMDKADDLGDLIEEYAPDIEFPKIFVTPEDFY
jgi:hypothetical protein